MSEMVIHKIVNTILQSCTYVLTKDGADDAYLVDCGDYEPVEDYLRKESKTPVGVFLTHSHYDHVYGLEKLLHTYPMCKVYANAETISGLEDPDLNMSYLYDEDMLLKLEEQQKQVIGDNWIAVVLGERVAAIATPGHDMDCMSFIIGDAIFTGDSYNPTSPVFCKWTRSYEKMAKDNEQRIKAIIQERKLFVCPGHQID